MKRSQIIICAFILVLVASCKTQEDIRREQTVQNLNEEIQQTKKSAASGNSRFMAIEEQMSRLNGQVEESNHHSSKLAQENKQLQDRLAKMEEDNKKQVEYLKALTEKVNNQSDYIEEVIESLKKLSDKQPEEKPKKKVVKDDDADGVVAIEDNRPATFDNGLKKYKEKEYDDARDIFQQVADNKKASKKSREGATHYLGMIELKNKKYESAKVYFSKVFSESPTSTYAPAALLNLGKTFAALKSKEEANMTYDELISRFPKSKEASEAAKLKK